MLNKLEFAAAMKSMDFEGEGDSMFAQLATTEKLSMEGGAPQAAISFDAFLTIVLQQYKDKVHAWACQRHRPMLRRACDTLHSAHLGTMDAFVTASS